MSRTVRLRNQQVPKTKGSACADDLKVRRDLFDGLAGGEIEHEDRLGRRAVEVVTVILLGRNAYQDEIVDDRK